MNAPERTEVLRETEHVPEHRGNPSGHALAHETCPNEQAPPRVPLGPHAPVRGTSETFVGGAGI
jgi:hypothetical protein